MPGQGFTVQGEGFFSTYILDGGQQRPIHDFVQPIGVFQTDVVGDAFHRTVRIGDNIYSFMLGILRQTGHAAQHHDGGQQQRNDLFHTRSFLSLYRAAFISRVECTMTLSRSSSIAGRRSSTTATLSSAPLAIRRHMEEIMSTLEYRPTP